MKFQVDKDHHLYEDPYNQASILVRYDENNKIMFVSMVDMEL